MNPALSLQKICKHCGTEFSASATSDFCCAGCEVVYDLIQTQGLDFYYQLKEQNPPTCPIPVSTSTSNFAYFDDPIFLKNLSSDGLSLRFYIEGLNCTACLWLLEKLPSFCSDAELARLDMSTSTLEVKKTPQGSFSEIARTLNRFGYRPHPISQTDSANEFQEKERHEDLIRIGIAGALTGNIMILAVSLYSGATGDLATQFRWLSAALATPVLTYCAWPFYRSVARAIQSKHLNLDVPIVIAILAGIISSSWSLMNSGENVYFDSLSMLVFLLLSSRLILRTIQNSQMRSTNLENELLLSSVLKVSETQTFESVSSLALIEGDQIKIECDRSVPVDGYVIKGKGSISSAVLTGESKPIQIKVGDYVEAGSLCLSGDWILQVKNRPNQTRLAQILRDTEKSSQEKSNFVRAADHVANWFVIIVMMSAILVVGYFASTNLSEGISRALALLIVTCPCVFGIAIPLSMSMAIRNAAMKGIIIKNSDSIEKLWNTRTLIFDKTGTLTTGSMEVLNVKPSNSYSPSDLAYVLGLEKNEKHPIARAITQFLSHQKIKIENFDNVNPISTGGICAEKNGQIHLLKPLSRSVEKFPQEFIQTDIGYFQNHQLRARFEIGDKIRAESPALILWARHKKFNISLVSGDKDNVVQTCAAGIGLKKNELHSEVTPENKAAFIRSFEKGTVMIGDGVNDAMALATADVGIAVCGSLDVSLKAADIYLTRNHLLLIPELFNIAQLTQSAIIRNLIFSASFNLLSGTLAILGYMTPLWAAVLMPLSSLTILLSAAWTGNQITKKRKTL